LCLLLLLHQRRPLFVLLVLLLFCFGVHDRGVLLLCSLFLLLDCCRLHEGPEAALVAHEVVEGINGLDLAGVHPYNAIAARKHPELVGGEDAALVLEQPEDCIVEDVSTHVGIDSAEGVVHQNDVRIEIDGAGNVQSLLLSS